MKPIIKEKSKRKVTWKKIILAAILAGVLFAAAGWAVFGMMVARQDITQLGKPLPAATILYDQNEQEASRISRIPLSP